MPARAARNNAHEYGWTAQALHWVMALVIPAMFAMGLWMRSLNYSHPWYHLAPWLHESTGVILAVLLVFRLVWRLGNPAPDSSFLKPYERRAAHAAHLIMYALLFGVVISGYLSATADGRPVDVFGVVSVPALIVSKGLEQQAHSAHEFMTHALVITAALHGLAALKHHFIDRNRVLVRMLPGIKQRKD